MSVDSRGDRRSAQSPRPEGERVGLRVHRGEEPDRRCSRLPGVAAAATRSLNGRVIVHLLVQFASSDPLQTADTSVIGAVDQRPPTWVFARGETTIRIQRLPGQVLHIDSNGNDRQFTFNDLYELTAFNC